MAHKTKAAATAAGKKAQQTLPNKGADWTLRVWENLDWHFCLQRGPISVYEAFDDQFHTMIASTAAETDHGGMMWSGPDQHSHHKTVAGSVRLAIEIFREATAEKRKIFNDLDAVLNPIDEELK